MTVRACAAIIQKNGKILITQRKRNQTFPLRWELPGGRIEPRESRESCLKREIKEEVGVCITAPRLYCTRRFRIKKNTLQIYYYLCRIMRGKPRRLEVNRLRWIAPSQHKNYNFLSPDRSVLERLVEDTVRAR